MMPHKSDTLKYSTTIPVATLPSSVLMQVSHLIKGRFILFNGDDIYSAEGVKKLLEHENGLLVSEVEHPEAFGIIETKADKLLKIDEKSDNPKGNLANIGIGGTGDRKKAINFLFNYLQKQGTITEGFISQSAGLIPLDGLLTPIKGNKILVGDAGGFIDPVTGAGIAYAWDSGKLAASLINGEISRQEFTNNINISYLKFLNRRKEKRKVFEEEWSNINKAVKKSWIAFSRE